MNKAKVTTKQQNGKKASTQSAKGILKVICINNKCISHLFNKDNYLLEEGKVYTVAEIRPGHDRDLTSNPGYKLAEDLVSEGQFSTERFIPLVDSTTEIARRIRQNNN